MSEKDSELNGLMAAFAAEFPPLIQKHGLEKAAATMTAVGKVFEAFKDIPEGCDADAIALVRKILDLGDKLRPEEAR